MNDDIIPYVCSGCGAKGVKLWRQYQTFADQINWLCAPCSIVNQKVLTMPNEHGMVPSDNHGSGFVTAIGWLVPAVPTIEGDTFWGYTSVPEDRVTWWKELPTWPPPKDDRARQALQAIADAEPRVHQLYDGQTYDETCDRCKELIAMAREGLEGETGA